MIALFEIVLTAFTFGTYTTTAEVALLSTAESIFIFAFFAAIWYVVVLGLMEVIHIVRITV